MSPIIAKTINKLTKEELHWQRTKHITIILMIMWFACTFGTIFFARELSAFRFFHWPVSFYMAAQGCVILYTAIVGYYACKMRHIDAMIENDNDHAE